MPRDAKALAQAAKEFYDRADAEGRDLTPDEREEVSGLIDAAYAQKSIDDRIAEVGGGFFRPLASTDPNYDLGGSDPGSRFVNSQGFKSIQDVGARGQQWSTGLVEVGSPLMMKGTLTEGSSAPGSGTGGGLVPTPQVIDGIVQTLFQPLTLESLLLSGVATTNTVRYATEGTATSGAAGVAEGGTKPESTIGISTKDEPVKKIATFLPISDELLEDAPAVQAFVNGQLGLFVNIEVERQLLRGTASGNEVQGILTGRNVPVYSVATGGTASLVAKNLFNAMNGVRGSAFVEPEWIVMHPTDWATLRLGQDTAGQYFGGGPFLGQYGNGSQVSSSGQLTGSYDTVWGKPVYVTSAIGGAGTALVGSRAAAQVWNRGGLRVEASNSHSTYFQQDLVAFRAERRLALATYRPSALCEVRF